MSGSEGIPAPEEVLPHRPPFLFLDEVTGVAPGEWAEGYWRPSAEADFFSGHFPGRPTLPGVLMTEALAQLGAYAVLLDDRFAGRLPLFGGMDGVRFKRQVLPGEKLELRVDVLRLGTRAGKAAGKACVDGETACSAELMFVSVPA